MSWWDPHKFSGLASQALKTAQKQIDKVLDIDERGKDKTNSSPKVGKSVPVSSGEDDTTKEEINSWNSWSSWMSPKTADSRTEMAEVKHDDSSSSSSSWGFNLGIQHDWTPVSASLSASTKDVSVTNKTSSLSAGSIEGLSESERQEKSMVHSEESSFAASECEKEEKSKVVEPVSVMFEQGETEDRLHEVQETVELPPVKETADHRVHIPEDEDPAALVSRDAVSPRTEEKMSELRTSPLLTSEMVEATVVGESEHSEESGWLDTDVIELTVDSAKEEHTGEKRTEQDLLENSDENSDEVNIPIGSEQREDSPEVKKSAADVPDGETGDPSTSQASYSMYETLEATPNNSSREEIPKHLPQHLDEEPALEAEQSPDSGLSRDSSFAQISFSENAQYESVTSVSSEPTLLTMSTEGRDPSMAAEEGAEEDLSLYSPASHSSLVQEENREVDIPSAAALSPDEETTPVSSPPVDSAALLSCNESATLSSESSEASRLDSSADTLVERSQQLTEEEEQEKGSREEEEEGQQWLGNAVSLAGLGSSASPSSSFVKCMIEEAMGMEDSSKHEDSGSDNHSEAKSESSKVDSEFEKSVYSGHESSDEIETTTSSDIEIISTPTPNGEKNIVDLSPIRFSLQKAASRSHVPSHHRTDSSSSSTNSKGEVDHLSPERDTVDPHPQHTHHPSRGARLDWRREEEDVDDPHHPQRLLKKLAEMAEVLQARERQVVLLSKDNNDLLETNSILRSQLQQAEEAREMTDLNALTEEFKRRMGESERKVQTILKEKEAIKEQLQVAQTELASRSADVSLEAELKEKDEQIVGLMEEGEKLSKQQLQNSNIIKRLRAKEKENETQLTSQKKKLDQQKEELDRLKVVLDSKEDMEKKQADAIKQLNTAVQMIEKEKTKLRVELEASEEKIRGLQTTLDSSYKELAELHKNTASQDSRAQQAALSAEMQVREELKMAMEQQSQQHRQEKEALLMQIEDLRMTLARMEKDHNRREEMLKQEITDLQMRLQEDESRAQELTQSVTQATRPLLRQIENLQATHSMQASAWEKVERNLTDRLTEAQTLLALAQEKERTATDRLTEASSRCAALESSNSLLRQEKAQLSAQLNSDRRRIEMMEERKENDVAQLELAKQKLSDEVATLRRDKVFLESQLETERIRLESEKQRVAVAEEQIRILERERPKSRGTPSPVSVSRQESMNSSFSERSTTPTWSPRQEEGEGQWLSSPGLKVSLYDSVRQSGAATFMESLQSQLKLREGEIAQLQSDIQQLERTRESMARELVNLTNLNEELQEQVNELPKMKTQFKELDGRYNALLQMYGEKEEKVQELMLDLEDVKEMYKQQINSLMK